LQSRDDFRAGEIAKAVGADVILPKGQGAQTVHALRRRQGASAVVAQRTGGENQRFQAGQMRRTRQSGTAFRPNIVTVDLQSLQMLQVVRPREYADPMRAEIAVQQAQVAQPGQVWRGRHALGVETIANHIVAAVKESDLAQSGSGLE
jgi:hypothetical protein